MKSIPQWLKPPLIQLASTPGINPRPTAPAEFIRSLLRRPSGAPLGVWRFPGLRPSLRLGLHPGLSSVAPPGLLPLRGFAKALTSSFGWDCAAPPGLLSVFCVSQDCVRVFVSDSILGYHPSPLRGSCRCADSRRLRQPQSAPGLLSLRGFTKAPTTSLCRRDQVLFEFAVGVGVGG